ncbi:MAG: peptide-methionine (R)-S-oxide reductase [Planctomycetota bacterium]|jgi:hypothetical protein
MPLTEQEWKEKLTPEEYRILRKKGTERAFTGKYDKFYEPGVYKCAGCGELLFTSGSRHRLMRPWSKKPAIPHLAWSALRSPALTAAATSAMSSTMGRPRRGSGTALTRRRWTLKKNRTQISKSVCIWYLISCLKHL